MTLHLDLHLEAPDPWSMILALEAAAAAIERQPSGGVVGDGELPGPGVICRWTVTALEETAQPPGGEGGTIPTPYAVVPTQ